MDMIDVSSNNHPEGEPIDWANVHYSGIDAVMVKATEGTTYVNPYFASDVEGAHKAGMSVGFYHFAHPVQNNVAMELHHFVDACRGHSHECGMALDFEDLGGRDPARFRPWVADFLHGLRSHTAWPVLYCDRSVLAGLGTGIAGHFLWIASPGVHPTDRPWAWQCGPATVPGISGPVDLDHLYAVPGKHWPAG